MVLTPVENLPEQGFRIARTFRRQTAQTAFGVRT
jgi:hypothetical protein